MCSGFERDPLLRSLLKLNPRERGRGLLVEVALCSMLLMVMDGTDLGPPLGCPRLVVMARRRAGSRRRSWWPGWAQVGQTLRIKRALVYDGIEVSRARTAVRRRVRVDGNDGSGTSQADRNG